MSILPKFAELIILAKLKFLIAEQLGRKPLQHTGLPSTPCRQQEGHLAPCVYARSIVCVSSLYWEEASQVIALEAQERHTSGTWAFFLFQFWLAFEAGSYPLTQARLGLTCAKVGSNLQEITASATKGLGIQEWVSVSHWYHALNERQTQLKVILATQYLRR